jgi:serine protease
VPGELIVRFAPSAAGAAERDEIVAAAGAQVKRDLRLPGYSVIEVPAGAERSVADALLQDGGVVSAEPSVIHPLLFTPNDDFFSLQWHFPQIGVPEAWDTTRGTGVTVAVLDSGVAYEDCTAAVCGVDYTRAPDFGGRIFVSPYDAVDGDAHPNDDVGHGTHIASTIGEATDNFAGVAGIAPDADLMPVRVCTAAGCSTAASAEGLVWAVDNGADIVNMSFGSAVVTTAERDAVNYALDHDVVVIAATGNSSEDVLACPACYHGVIATGATRLGSSQAPYSNYGTNAEGDNSISLVAPGGDISQDVDGDHYIDGILQQSFDEHCHRQTVTDLTDFAYCFLEGTSMASAHVAGVAALVLSVNPELTNAQAHDILLNTARDLGAIGYDETFGFGEVDAAAAVEAAGKTVGQPTPTATAPGPTETRTPTRTPTQAALTGDANKDGEVDAIDAALVLQHTAGLLPSINAGADANHSGGVDAIDAALILQLVAGLLDELP